MWKDCTSCSYNPGQKSRTVLQYSYFSVISRFRLKTVHPFRNFLAVFLSPILYKVEILDTSVQNSLWGEGWTSVNWKRPQKCKSVPRLFSMIVGLSLFLRNQGFSLFEGRDSGLRVCRRCRMPKITIEITGRRKNSGRDYGIIEPYWGPSIWTCFE